MTPNFIGARNFSRNDSAASAFTAEDKSVYDGKNFLDHFTFSEASAYYATIVPKDALKSKVKGIMPLLSYEGTYTPSIYVGYRVRYAAPGMGVETPLTIGVYSDAQVAGIPEFTGTKRVFFTGLYMLPSSFVQHATLFYAFGIELTSKPGTGTVRFHGITLV